VVDIGAFSSNLRFEVSCLYLLWFLGKHPVASNVSMILQMENNKQEQRYTEK
jgi:hypothetical protein